MNYYKDTQNNIASYSDEQLLLDIVKEEILNNNLISITEQEAEEILNTPPVLTLEEVKKNKLEEVNNSYQQAVAQLKAGIPEDEILTWDIQRLEAMAWDKDNTALTPNLDIIALSRGVDRVLLIQKVLEKSALYEQYIFAFTGTRQKLEDAINAATTVEEVQAISWS